MANWCGNSVQFDCSPETMEKIIAFFDELKAKGDKKNCGQLPAFIKADTGYMFDIYWADGVLYYDTKWSPNIDIMVAIAAHFGASFTYSYDEMSMLVYGEAEYKYGVLTDICLELPDFEAYTFDEAKEVYLFEGEEYEVDYEILEILLERKKYQLEHTDCIKN
jgi:hypothetical protein